MKNKKLLSLALFSTLVANTLFATAFASSETQWPTTGSAAPLQVTVDGTSSGQISPILVKDSNGDYVHYWVDQRNTFDGQIFGQKVDSNGNIAWTTGDVLINSAPNGVGYISPAVADSNGNTYIAYSDYNGNILVMQTSSSGTVNWTTQVSDSNTGYSPNLLADSNNNIWVNWYDDHATDTVQAVALLDSNGNPPATWNTSGTGTHRVLSLTTALLAAPVGSNLRSNMALSNANSLLLSFENLNQGTTHVIKINNDGSFPWTFSPGSKKYLTVDETILDETFTIGRTTAYTDHNNGMYVAYSNTNNTSVRVVHIDQDGNFLSGSATSGVELATTDGIDFYVGNIQITSDLDGNFFLAYEIAERIPDDFIPHLMAQKFNSTLTPQWNAGNFIEVHTAYMDDPDLRYYNLLPDYAGGLILGFYEYTGLGGGPGRLYAERILSLGSNDWASIIPPLFVSVPLDLTNGDLAGGSEVSLVSNGCNGAVFNWTNLTYIYTQNVISTGATCPSGATVPDAPTGLNGTPGDGQVVLNWTAPANDGGSAITNYFVQYKRFDSVDWLTDTSAPSTSTTRTITFLTNNIAYDFRVAAVNAIGTGAYSSQISSTPTAGGGGGGCVSGGNVICGTQNLQCPGLVNSFGTGTDSPANFQIGDDGARSISSSNDTAFVQSQNSSYFDNDNDSVYNDLTDDLAINSNTPFTCAGTNKAVQLSVSATPFLNSLSQNLLSYGADNVSGGTSTGADYYAMLSIITSGSTTCDTGCTLAEGAVESNNGIKHGEENFFASATLGASAPAAGFDDTAILIDNDGGLNTVTLYSNSKGFEGTISLPGLKYNLALPANPAFSGSFSSTITYTLNS